MTEPGMKLYYIVNAKMPNNHAHGIQIAKMCEAFVELGVDLELVVPRRIGSRKSLREYYGLRNDIAVRRLPVVDTYAWGPVGYFFGALTFMISSSVFLLWLRIRRVEAVIYTMDMDRFSFMLFPYFGFRCFSELHGPKQPTVAFRVFFRKLKAIFAINERIKQETVKQFSLPESRVFAFPNGIDVGQFASGMNKANARRKLGIPAEGFVVMYTGAFLDWKGLDTVLKSAVSNSGDETWYLVGGTKDELLHATGAASVPEYIHCPGKKSHAEIPVWLAAADVLLLSGTKRHEYSYRYTSPMKLFEYMAAERPIIAARTPAIEQVVSEQEVFFYEPDDEQSLRSMLERIKKTYADTAAKTAHARRYVEQFEWKERARKISEIIKNYNKQ